MNEKKESEKEERPSFISEAVRRPRTGVYQQLLAQKLKVNRVSDPLQRITLLCEAAYMSRNKDALDMKIIDIAAAACRSFLNTDDSKKEPWVNIAWVFPPTEENYVKYIKPWLTVSYHYYPTRTIYAYVHYGENLRYQDMERPASRYEKITKFFDEIKKRIYKEINEKPDYERFFIVTTAISKTTLQAFKGEFTNWMLPKLLEQQSIIVDEIDPQVYLKTLSLIAEKMMEKEEE